ncbi:hypothetical protein PVA45_06485 [Entomospira entomophila]|uniref:Lipoprotein n=1 Tax=Entomospira entomophila TaxID=2719988 RepID=A0A968KU70_9SPIO|nr:hypothetical protein [Entomospira entomophilus]NIZ41146.1 hypothetical protein [Entomospira entomophilus]WDI35353.1 hypothetical protein PVA45_06485 [Entomospira entomophilus]
MKKLFLLLGALFVVSCGANNSSNIINGATALPYTADHDETEKFLKKYNYKPSNLSKDEIIALLSEVNSLQSWLKDGAHRTSAQSFSIKLGSETVSAVTLFDQNELFTLFIPYSPVSRKQFDNLVSLASAKFGESEAQDSETHVNHYWALDEDKSFQLVYKTENSEFLLLAIDQSIRAKNDLAFFDSIPPTDNTWFLQGFLGSTYESIAESETYLYSAAGDNKSLLYITKFDTTPILYGYLFNAENLVETIVFQNIEGKEDILAEIFNKQFNIQARKTTEEVEGSLTLTSYEWDLEGNAGASILIYEQKFGEHSVSQSYAFITDDFEELKSTF